MPPTTPPMITSLINGLLRSSWSFCRCGCFRAGISGGCAIFCQSGRRGGCRVSELSNGGSEGVISLPLILGFDREDGIGGDVVAKIGVHGRALEGNGLAPKVDT
jgi:hypothetical protein